MTRKRSYPDTPLGAARSHKDKQNGRLSDMGHSMRWRRLQRPAYLGRCQNCRGEVECHQYGAQYRGGIIDPSLLKFPGVNIIRRCPGGRS